MKIQEYIDSPNFLNRSNVFTLAKYEQWIHSCNLGIVIPLSQDMLEYQDIHTVFKQYRNCILFISNADIDFPPPKKPYTYDKYFNKDALPTNYLEINYYDKIDTELLNIIQHNNLRVVCHALSINHPYVTMVPLSCFHYFNHFHLKTCEKTILCYANFGLACDRWFGNPRNIVHQDIQKLPFIICDNIGATGRHFHHNYYYDKIARSKFAICPRGCGIDSYRLWDCILLGCIPIVEKYDGMQQFNDLPILFIDSYKDYGKLTEEYLNTVYQEFQQRDFNYEKLLDSYWKYRIVEIYHSM